MSAFVGRGGSRVHTTRGHVIEAPRDGGIVVQPKNGTLVHLYWCQVCGERVSKLTGQRVGWRHLGPRGPRGNYSRGVRQSDLRWPYGASDDALVGAINEAVPRNLPEQIRDEACQELALAVLEGRTTLADLAEAARDAMGAARSGYQFSARFEVSMDIPLGQDARSPLKDLLAASAIEGVARITDDIDDSIAAPA